MLKKLLLVWLIALSASCRYDPIVFYSDLGEFDNSESSYRLAGEFELRGSFLHMALARPSSLTPPTPSGPAIPNSVAITLVDGSGQTLYFNPNARLGPYEKCPPGFEYFGILFEDGEVVTNEYLEILDGSQKGSTIGFEVRFDLHEPAPAGGSLSLFRFELGEAPGVEGMNLTSDCIEVQ